MDYFLALDAGHSYYSSGKETAIFPDGTRMKEWEFNWAVVKKLFKKLESYSQIDVFLTNTEKYDVTLENRCDRANRAWQAYQDKLGKANVRGVLVSVHANALTGVWGTQNGTSTHYYPNNVVDKAFAEVVNKNLVAEIGLRNRGNIGSDFQILRDVKMTACLCECAFMDNLKEAELLRTDEFREKCAEGILNGILEYFGIAKIGGKSEMPKVEIPVEKPKPVKPKVEYTKTVNNTFMLSSDVENLKFKEVSKSNAILLEENYINSTFFSYEATGRRFSTSILYADGVTYRRDANHLPSPQSVFIVNKDNSVEMKRIKSLNELNLSKVRIAIGGVGIINKLDSTFKYDPAFEGFKGVYSDVIRKTNKTMIVYNKSEDKIYLVCRPNIFHKSSLYYDLVDLAGDIGDICCALDGGNSSVLGANNKIVFGGSGRIIHSILYF